MLSFTEFMEVWGYFGYFDPRSVMVLVWYALTIVKSVFVLFCCCFSREDPRPKLKTSLTKFGSRPIVENLCYNLSYSFLGKTITESRLRTFKGLFLFTQGQIF